MSEYVVVYDTAIGGLKSKAAGVGDEKVAVISGGTAGYLWGDGTNGILRVDTSLLVQKDSANAYITMFVGTVDCGTF